MPHVARMASLLNLQATTVSIMRNCGFSKGCLGYKIGIRREFDGKKFGVMMVEVPKQGF